MSGCVYKTPSSFEDDQTHAGVSPVTTRTEIISTQSTHAASLWDRLGIVGSTLCLLHCAATPLFIGVFSVTGVGIVGGEHFHGLAALILGFVALLAFLPGFRRHRDWRILVAGGLGVSSLVIGGFVLLPSELLETLITIMGSLILVMTHGINWRLTRKSACCANRA